MKIYAVIDTNVIVSALIPKREDSPTRLILDYLLKGRIILVYNEEILKEYLEVLTRSKFKLSKDLVLSFLDIIRQTGLFKDRVHSEVDMPDAKDVVFYEVTLSKKSAYLVTGNIKHFPKEKFIVTPSEMIDIMEHSNN